MFNIDTPEMINRISTYKKEEIEPLYWLIEDSIDKGELQLAKSVYKDFACIAKYNKNLLVENLKSVQLNRLKNLSYELFGDSVIIKQKSITIMPNSECRPIPFKKESELRDYLYSRPEMLSSVYGDKIELINKEVKTNFEFRCDLVLESETYCYPTEIKIGQATHGVVSQIHKYCHYFYKRYRYGLHRNIQGVVIANGFDSYSVNELRKNNIWCFNVVPKSENDIELIRLSSQ